MRVPLWFLAALLLALPLAAQQEDLADESPSGFSGPAGPPRNFVRNPVERMEEVLAKAGVPLSQDQKKSLQAVMDEQRQSFRQFREQNRQSPQEGRGRSSQAGQMREFQEKISALLSADQQAVWKKDQAEQIRRRGGYPALQLMLQEAGSPLGPDQEGALQAEFRDYLQQRRELQQAAGEKADSAKLKDLENQHLARVVRLLNGEQRRALLESRRKEAQPSN